MKEKIAMRLPLAFCLVLFSLPAAAQILKPTMPKKLTLAQALSALPPPKDGLLLTIGSEKVSLPDGTDAPPAGASLPDIAAAFGEITPSFGSVTAVAPASMVLLNSQPDPPNLAKDVNAMIGLDMLAASLDDAQWQNLTSAQGLGLGDLTDETQQALFHALFNHGHLWIGSEDPALNDVPQEQRTDVRDVTDQIDGIRLRLGQRAGIDLHDKKGKTLFFGGERPDAASRLHTYHPRKAAPVVTEHNVVLRAATPNTPKSGDLDLEAKAFQVTVPTPGLRTVGEMVTRVGQMTKLELYADPHYAGKTLTITGPAATATAEDLLRAVCLCVTGTFRKVGTAYVLTDDLIGVGIRRKHLEDWENKASNDMMSLERNANKIMLKRRGVEARTLPTFGDPLAVTPEQMAAIPDAPGMPGIPTMRDNTFPFAKLTPAQKTWMRQVAADYDEKHHNNTLPSYLDGDDIGDVDLTRNVDFDVNYQLQFLVPTISTPVDCNLEAPLWIMFYTGDTPEARKDYAALQAKESAKLPPAPLLSAMLGSGQIRAVFGRPRTALEVDALVAAMQKLKLNALILDVYSDGVNHVAASGHGPDILTEAVNRTRGTGIAVFADLSLLSWGAEPPDSLHDLTIDGQTSRQAAVEANSGTENENLDDAGNPIPFVAPPVRVSPAASGVQEALAAVVRQIAAQPGLAGFVWEDADADANLGYTPQMRLAFLRAFYADPVDINTETYLRADSTLPLFDDETLDKKLPEQWMKFNQDTDTALLTQLYAAAQGSSVRPILMEQDSFRDNWLASWDNPKQTPPPLRDLTPGVMFPSQMRVMRAARTQSRLLVRSQVVEKSEDITLLSRKMQDAAKALPSDGFVLYFKNESMTQGTAPLDALVNIVTAEKAGTPSGAVKNKN